MAEFKAKREEYELFHDLWKSVTDTLQTAHKLSDEDLESATNVLKSPFKRHHECSEFSSIDFDDYRNCCAYLVRYATTHTLMTKFATEILLDRIPSTIAAKWNADESLAIVSVGGGPGNDILGFCSAFRSLPSFCIKTFKACTFDRYNSWMEVQKQLLCTIRSKAVGSHDDFFGSPPLELNFVNVDITMDSEQIGIKLHKLKEADVILLVKVLSILKLQIQYKVLMTIFNAMKPGSIFLYVDTQADSVMKVARKVPSIKVLLLPHGKKRFESNTDCQNCISYASFEICALLKPCR